MPAACNDTHVITIVCDCLSILRWLYMTSQAVREAAEQRQQQDESAAASAAPAQAKPKQAPAPKRKPAVPLMRVKPVKKQGKAQPGAPAASDSRLVEGRPAERPHDSGRVLSNETEKPDSESAENGLGGLMGAYGSESEDD